MAGILSVILMFMAMIGLPILLLPIIWGVNQFINARQSAYRFRQWQHFALSQGLNLNQRRSPSRWGFWPDIEGVYAGHFLRLRSYAQGPDTFTELSLTTTPSPPPTTEVDLDWFSSKVWSELKGWLSAEPGGQRLIYRQGGFEGDPQRLAQVAELLAKIAAVYPSILKLGASAVPHLQPLATTHDSRNYSIRLLARQLLRDIARDTYTRLHDQPHRAICRRCLAYPSAHQIVLTLTESLSYYGCRVCGQSQDFLHGEVVAVLDSRMEAEVVEREGRVEVNWLRRQSLFDFNWVEIRQATDEQVERLMMQIGNDTDPVRRPRYQHLNCLVAPDCVLSLNSLRLLERFLGKVHLPSPKETAGVLPQKVATRRRLNAAYPDHDSSDTQTLHAI